MRNAKIQDRTADVQLRRTINSNVANKAASMNVTVNKTVSSMGMGVSIVRIET